MWPGYNSTSDSRTCVHSPVRMSNPTIFCKDVSNEFWMPNVRRVVQYYHRKYLFMVAHKLRNFVFQITSVWTEASFNTAFFVWLLFSQDHRTGQVVRDHCGSSVPTSLLEHVHARDLHKIVSRGFFNTSSEWQPHPLRAICSSAWLSAQ